MLKTLKVDIEDNGKRFDNYLIKILKNAPKSLIYCMIRKGVSGSMVKAKSIRLRLGKHARKIPTKYK